MDLSEVTFMDSTGIGVLLNALRHFTIRHLTIFDSREKALGELA